MGSLVGRRVTRRRLILVIAIATLTGGGAATVLAGNVQNVRQTATVAQAEWSDVDRNGNGDQVAIEVANVDGSIEIDLRRSTGSVVACGDSGTPGDPSDDVYGFIGTDVSGTGTGTLTVATQYRGAKAAGTVRAEVTTIDECTGDVTTTGSRTISVALDLTAIGPIVRETNRSTIAIPGQFRSHELIRAVSRDAAGTMKLGSRTLPVDAVIGRLTLQAHANGS
jgi:hypothetical protein